MRQLMCEEVDGSRSRATLSLPRIRVPHRWTETWRINKIKKTLKAASTPSFPLSPAADDFLGSNNHNPRLRGPRLGGALGLARS